MQLTMTRFAEQRLGAAVNWLQPVHAQQQGELELGLFETIR
jgi:hypothetical protein